MIVNIHNQEFCLALISSSFMFFSNRNKSENEGQKILTKKIIEKILAMGQVYDDPVNSVTEDLSIRIFSKRN